MKKLMSLGGNYFQMTLVKAAKRLGCYVIDVDYLPDNPAHRFADEYHNISTLDKDAVLKLAFELKIDGIVSYASDVSAPTAAYVAEKLGLPGNPLRTIEIMTDKTMFHPFLREHGYIAPNHVILNNEKDARSLLEKSRSGKIMIKPSHGSGSKGVSVVSSLMEVDKAYEEAKKYARCSIIGEEYIQRDYYQVAGDAFVKDGKIVFFGLANEHFDKECNPLVPIGESFPADLSQKRVNKARGVIEKVLNELGYNNGAVNLDFMFDENGEVFIIELGPRNGGNLITDAIKLSCGVDLAEYTVKCALGEDISDLQDKPMKRYISSCIWHAVSDGVYDKITYGEEIKDKIISSDMFVSKGDRIYEYNNGSFGLGAALLEFNNLQEMLYTMDNMNKYYSLSL